MGALPPKPYEPWDNRQDEAMRMMEDQAIRKRFESND